MDQALVERAKSLIDELAQTPRFAGSAEESRARAHCRRELEQAGFKCEEIPFEYSQWLGLWGTPLVSLALASVIFAMSALTRAGYAIAPSVAVAALFAAVWASASSLGKGWILTFPWSRATGANLEARRGNPRVWLVAHLDSKSQTVPMLLRIAGTISLYFAGMLAALGGLAYLIWGGIATPALIAAQALAVLGALAAGLCFVRNTSPGAVDNASGVAAVLLAARLADRPDSLGVLVTSGEELGLAGALAWARTAPDKLVILNCDTIDEAGPYRFMYSGGRPIRLSASAENVANHLGVAIKIGNLIPGIMADSMVFAAPWRWSAITLSRGSLATLARIHTRGDNSTKLTGEGAAQASALLSAMARELT